MAPIALITDFGIADWYVAEMKGAVLSIAPGSTIIDISHHISPGDIKSAAFTLAACYRTFPEGTVFCAVVDPGVGSGRRAIAADSGAYRFVGPDNGVLSWALMRETTAAVRIIENCTFFRGEAVSATFHGRDIFGPVAAHLSLGTPFVAVGPETVDYHTIPFPHPVAGTTAITAEILAVDRFGNVVTSADATHLSGEPEKISAITICSSGNCRTVTFGSHFQSVPQGELLVYTGSAGFLEIGCNGGNAATILGLRPGDRVEMRFA